MSCPGMDNRVRGANQPFWRFWRVFQSKTCKITDDLRSLSHASSSETKKSKKKRFANRIRRRRFCYSRYVLRHHRSGRTEIIAKAHQGHRSRSLIIGGCPQHPLAGRVAGLEWPQRHEDHRFWAPFRSRGSEKSSEIIGPLGSFGAKSLMKASTLAIPVAEHPTRTSHGDPDFDRWARSQHGNR